MFLSISIIGCAILTCVPHVARCQSDALSGMEKGFVRVRSKSDNEDVSTDIDSGESQTRGNVNVNVNSNGPLPFPWHQPEAYRPNRSNFQPGRGRRKTLNDFMPSIRLSPNSNVDFNFANSHGNVRLSKKGTRRKISKRKPKSSEDLELLGSSKGSYVCYPIILRTVEHLKRIETTMVDLEKELRTFLLGSQDENSNES